MFDIKTLVCAAAVAMAPAASSALTTTAPVSYSTSDSATAVFMAGPSPSEVSSGGSFSFNVTNDSAGHMSIVFDFLSNFGFNDLLFTFAGMSYADDFTASMSAGATETLTISFSSAGSPGSIMSAEISAVPLPASALLLVGALGGLGLAWRRKS